ncbi:sulfite reductase subunit alpha [Nibricoccus aquaticus]|uniref:assimilatory sulfite reductase (NADPH) n=1 Tax=Nibricoccus aquaticus TaxID=2576891 RepID=A0A290QDZ6_9BACT|nr:sulfite reductase subunit alpha [Nibricoccus aquaticus]ATC62561.1 sulfite reductase subunit alpha [Nibricoccus aquaticus]
MSSIPLLPETAPFSPEQRAWLNGFFAGLFSRTNSSAAPAVAAATLQPLTILFGSQTGTSESLAKRAAKEAGKRGFAPTVVDMAQTDIAKLAGEKNALVITSTYGDGEPPDNAKSLWEALAKDDAPSLASLNFSVCALGDTNYAQFCRCGIDFDQRLEKCGAKRIADRADCDLEYDEKFTKWLDASLNALGSASAAPSPAATSSAPAAATDSDAHGESLYSKKNPYASLLLSSRNLNAPGSAKSVHHIEFDLAGSGLAYEAGDALGVIPHNCPELVADVLTALGFDGEEAIASADGSTTSLRQALTTTYDLGKPSPDLLAAVAKKTTAPVTAGASVAATSPAPHHVIDVLHAYPDAKFTAAEFVALLKKIQPRLYSISSSPKAHPGQVHLTVGAVRYDLHGRPRKGVCSTFLADRAKPGDTRIGVFVHSNKAFRPPANPDAPMIMVGPGTGIAPFRAFLEERMASGAKGKNWLFFGDQKASTDFLYQDELTALQKSGVLTRLDTAFSRDQQEKIYVQNRMLEAAAELFAWLEAGGHFYVCGDASRMAKDVDAALHKVVELAGKKTPEQAAAYIQNLKTTKRYARDVY